MRYFTTGRHHRALVGGFTLVELLVVIGVLVLLISILLPTLGRVREAARRAACASNMRQLGVGSTVYANQNKAAIPPVSRSAAPRVHLAAPHHLYVAYGAPNLQTPPPPDVTLVPFNLGILHQQRIITTGKVFYCPATVEDELAQSNENVYPQPWGSATRGPTDNYVRAGYAHSPHVANEGGNLPGFASQLLYPTLPRYPVDKFLGVDRLSRLISHGDGWNALYRDSSVQFIRNDSVLKVLKNGLAVANYSDWSNFRRVINALESGKRYDDAPTTP